MLEEMSAAGGQSLAEGGQAPEWLAERIRSALKAPDHLLLLVDSEEPGARPFGIVEASITQPHPVFEPRRIVHIHCLYVEPEQRRQGVARALLEAALQWGRDRGCVEASLNVLVRNEARSLYECLGFEVFEWDMRRPL
jgi:GNAT superfamily N-acetyltransferase